MDLTRGERSASLTEEMGLSRTDSERPKMNERMRLYVGEDRKSWWSLGERILRVGMVKVRVAGSGGGGASGVSGTGTGFAGSAFFRRPSSFGMRSFRFGMPRLAPGGGGGEVWLAPSGTVSDVDAMFHVPLLGVGRWSEMVRFWVGGVESSHDYSKFKPQVGGLGLKEEEGSPCRCMLQLDGSLQVAACLPGSR